MPYIIHDEDQNVIWAVGNTVTEAWADFSKEMAGNGIEVLDEEPDGPEGPNWTLRSRYTCRPATEALAEAVRQAGGRLVWGIMPDRTTAGTQDEYDPA